MKLLSLTCARMQDGDENQFLRLDTDPPNASVWYKPDERGFEVLSDEQSESLEHFYQQLLKEAE